MGSRMGRAIVANASMQFLLKQSPSAVDVLTDVFKLTSEEKKRDKETCRTIQLRRVERQQARQADMSARRHALTIRPGQCQFPVNRADLRKDGTALGALPAHQPRARISGSNRRCHVKDQPKQLTMHHRKQKRQASADVIDMRGAHTRTRT